MVASTRRSHAEIAHALGSKLEDVLLSYAAEEQAAGRKTEIEITAELMSALAATAAAIFARQGGFGAGNLSDAQLHKLLKPRLLAAIPNFQRAMQSAWIQTFMELASREGE